tara:strand:+ start:223 stop:441 length:219 start_codon:yes stop_codon:yes gene_type:complete
MNGLDLLIGMAIVAAVAYILSKISLLKQEKQFWKDSCFIMAEKYNDLLVKDQLKKVEKSLDNIVNNQLNELN